MSIRCSLGHESPDGSAFCDECGEPLAGVQPASASAGAAPAQVGNQVCPSCGAANPAGDAFCSNCGANLLGGPTPVTAGAPTAGQTGTRSARLIVEASNQEFDLSGKDNITIGREDVASNSDPDVDLTPHGGVDGYVSRLHARIFYENGQYMLEDENSTNFTSLNRQRLAPNTPVALHDNDEIKLGLVRLRFRTP